MKTVGITGGAGFVGQHLTELLISKGYEVIIFTRNVSGKAPRSSVTYAHWDADKGECDINSLKKADAVVHLAGEGIADKRWTAKRKQQIVDSRVKGTDFLVAQLKAYAPGCKTLVAASATGFYGPDRAGRSSFREDAPAYSDFLGDTCKQWEAASQKAASFTRTLILRFGIVLGKESGAFPQFERPMSFGIVPILGSGEQVVSWIGVEDLVSLVLFGIEHAEIEGIFNAVAPAPVSHRELMKTIARVKGGIKITAPVPSFLLKAALGELSEEVLKSCTVSADKILAASFTFTYPDITSAVRAILGKQ